MIGTVALTQLIAGALQSSKAFQILAQDTYEKSWLVECGFDRRRVEWTQAAPFAVLVAGGTRLTEGMPLVEHSIGIVLGVTDKEHLVIDGTVPELRGIHFLGERAWPCVLDALERGLATLPGCSLAEAELEFSQESHPLLYLNAAFSIHESLPVGRR